MLSATPSHLIQTIQYKENWHSFTMLRASPCYLFKINNFWKELVRFAKRFTMQFNRPILTNN